MPNDSDTTQSPEGDSSGSPTHPPNLLEKRPTDLSEHVPLWLERATMLAASSAVQGVVSELHALSARQEQPGFRLAFVGEFSRGKSTLINRLLDRPILPVGQVPTTRTITSISAGPEEGMIIQYANGRQERRPLQHASWEDLMNDGEPDGTQVNFPLVRLTLKHPWLSAQDLELIDTPGVADLKDQRSTCISAFVSRCDAAVLVVSAESPFSLTETALLEQGVVGKHVPNVLVVVSHFDRIAEDQQRLLTAIQKRVAYVSPLIPVIPAHALTSMTSDIQALEVVRASIEQIASQADRQAWRSQQVAYTLVDQLGTLVTFATMAISLAHASAAEREELLQEQSRQARSAASRWDQIIVALDTRRLEVDQGLRKLLSSEKDKLKASLLNDLTRAADVQTWWGDYPDRLKLALNDVALKAESFVVDSLRRDVKWLQDEIVNVFNTRIEAETPGGDGAFTVVTNVRDLSLPDVELQRLFVKSGVSVAIIGTALVLNPIFAAAALAGILAGGTRLFDALADFALSSQVKQQREEVKAEVVRSIENSIDAGAHQMSTWLKEASNRIGQEMKREQLVWQESMQHAIMISGESTVGEQQEQQLHQLIADATTLRGEILATLNGQAKT